MFLAGIFDYIDDDTTSVLEQGPLKNLARDNQLAVYLHEVIGMPAIHTAIF